MAGPTRRAAPPSRSLFESRHCANQSRHRGADESGPDASERSHCLLPGARRAPRRLRRPSLTWRPQRVLLDNLRRPRLRDLGDHRLVVIVAHCRRHMLRGNLRRPRLGDLGDHLNAVNGSAFPPWLKSVLRVMLQLRRAAVLRPWNAFAFLLASSLATMASQSSWANGFSRVRHVRGCVISLGSFAAFTYFLAVFRSMSALRAARPISPCLLISSISFLTCASLTARKTPASSSRKRVVLEHRVTRQ